MQCLTLPDFVHWEGLNRETGGGQDDAAINATTCKSASVLAYGVLCVEGESLSPETIDYHTRSLFLFSYFSFIIRLFFVVYFFLCSVVSRSVLDRIDQIRFFLASI